MGGAPAIAGDVEVVIAPPFPWLTDVAAIVQDSPLKLAAQNMHAEVGGAYTGEVSPRMLRGLCEYVLVGQYERRILFGDKEAIVRRKVQSAQEQGLKPVLCVGENADQLDEGIGLYVVKEIVSRHNGTVGVESVEGEGSTFIIRLPLASEHEDFSAA